MIETLAPTVRVLLPAELDFDDVLGGVEEVHGVLYGQPLGPDVIDGQDSVTGLYGPTSDTQRKNSSCTIKYMSNILTKIIPPLMY